MAAAARARTARRTRPGRATSACRPRKARAVLDLIRARRSSRPTTILRLSERGAALVVRKVLRSAVANAEHNDGLDADELYVRPATPTRAPPCAASAPGPAAGPPASASAPATSPWSSAATTPTSWPPVVSVAARSGGAGGRGRCDTSTSRRRWVARSRGEDVAEETTTDEAVDETPQTLAEEAAGTAAEGAETVDEAIEAGRGRRVTEEHTAQSEAETAEELSRKTPRTSPRRSPTEVGADVAEQQGRSP